jgi:hypothetical protein
MHKATAGFAQHYTPFFIPLKGLRVQVKQNSGPDLFSLFDENTEMPPVTAINTANPRASQAGRRFGNEKCHVEDPDLRPPLPFTEIPKLSDSVKQSEPLRANKNPVAPNTVKTKTTALRHKPRKVT